ncbi:N-acetylmuramoyl-L-alanine amidase [Alkalihalobacillus sp. 1P02AB]|uniref:N-acetylmuramoyl-L-alanine amidase n=1 Tax=Alkalihalobacillus sp. 1P02AB TaxID=3132260 RepID=UPI0039A47AC5
MKKIIKLAVVLSLFLIVVLWNSNGAAETNTRLGKVQTQTGGSLNVRDLPNVDSEIIGHLKVGQLVEYVAVNGGWGKITYNGRVGYINLDYMSNSSEQTVYVPTNATSENNSSQQEIRQIVIDPGHGGRDPGGHTVDVEEKAIVLDVVKRVKDKLLYDGYEVIMTRETDTYISLESRVSVANDHNADLFLSIHANIADDSSVNGVETHYIGDSASFAQLLQTTIVNTVNTNDRGLFESPFYVLRNTNMLSVLLEIGYLTNDHDLYLLQTESHKEQLANAIVYAIKGY